MTVEMTVTEVIALRVEPAGIVRVRRIVRRFSMLVGRRLPPIESQSSASGLGCQAFPKQLAFLSSNFTEIAARFRRRLDSY